MSEDNPLMALLQKNPVETDLDKHFKQSEAAKNSPTKTAGPVLVLDDTDDSEDAPIGLTHRQPSFSSLHGNQIVMKGGNAISNLNEVSELDEENLTKPEKKEEDDMPIGLNVRHSSYAVLSLENSIPKGESVAKKISNIVPISEIKEEDSLILPVNDQSDPQNEDEEAEEDYNPQVIMVKQLKAKNTGRWKEMGYEPPKDLIPLVRAASQSIMAVSSLTQEQPHPTLSYIAEKLPDPIPAISEEPSPSNTKKDIQRHQTRPRSGSFGMKLGEASESQHLLENIISTIPKRNENQNSQKLEKIEDEEIPEEVVEEDEAHEEESGVDSDQLIEQEEEEIVEVDEESSESIPDAVVDEITEALFGRLDKIVVEDEDSPVFQALQNGYVENEEDIPEVKKALQKYLKITKGNNWYDEAKFILSILSNIPEITSHRENEVDKIQLEIQKTFEEKEKSIDELFDLLDSSINALDDEYLEEAHKLDVLWQNPKTLAKYNKPSSDLINLRSRLHSAIINSQTRDVKILQKHVEDIERKETKVKNTEISKAYFRADQQLKEKFVQKRVAVTKKSQEQIDRMEQEYEKKVELLKAQLSYAKFGRY
ncbi:hypothetical protein TVAG_391240 [Trichomonas vaginalis G3]|uniref:Uncharacterized protein n=1 Tax=Trichomonas vaginalis (strain ATCC PRA-98 / G3) TaxID=412133 RepID=A2DFN7_TRIV3|nr:hypothetical protein TVAGG3_0323730 [Trichomonas vaginalis G3]EAY20740.1 hypothetical protein TVAG_391240 [Trichomonas vaginalis G3]KAI5529485.1 hypothetical protein TVAGG3_0323730 [Trichomonas vaginalis G3]|eukprot:XP_001581726.1 hypothetical protein [Trichomonas vaginalis G3]